MARISYCELDWWWFRARLHSEFGQRLLLCSSTAQARSSWIAKHFKSCLRRCGCHSEIWWRLSWSKDDVGCHAACVWSPHSSSSCRYTYLLNPYFIIQPFKELKEEGGTCSLKIGLMLVWKVLQHIDLHTSDTCLKCHRHSRFITLLISLSFCFLLQQILAVPFTQ